jgi:hypothetical protein
LALAYRIAPAAKMDADSGIARHQADGVEVLGSEQSRAAHSRRSQRRLAAGVPGSDHNHIIRALALHAR